MVQFEINKTKEGIEYLVGDYWVPEYLFDFIYSYKEEINYYG